MLLVFYPPPMKLKFTIVLLILSGTQKVFFGIGVHTNTKCEDVRISRVENGLILLSDKKMGEPAKLADRMQFYKVPGVSVAVISGGKLQWARGYGLLEVGKTIR